MVVLICFDLPRYTKLERKQATKFRQQLVELGFEMVQYSVYERHVENSNTIKNILEALHNWVPEKGEITAYHLSDEIYKKQNIILGAKVVRHIKKEPQLIYL